MENDPIYKQNLILEIKKVDYSLELIPMLIEKKLAREKPGPGFLLIWNDKLLYEMEVEELFDLLVEINPKSVINKSQLDFNKYEASWIEEFKNNPDHKKPFLKYLLDRFNLEVPIPDQFKRN